MINNNWTRFLRNVRCQVVSLVGQNTRRFLSRPGDAKKPFWFFAQTAVVDRSRKKQLILLFRFPWTETVDARGTRERFSCRFFLSSAERHKTAGALSPGFKKFGSFVFRARDSPPPTAAAAAKEQGRRVKWMCLARIRDAKRSASMWRFCVNGRAMIDGKPISARTSSRRRFWQARGLIRFPLSNTLSLSFRPSTVVAIEFSVILYNGVPRRSPANVLRLFLTKHRRGQSSRSFERKLSIN